MQALESNYPLKPKETFSLFLSFSDTDRREGGADMTGRPMRFSAFAHISYSKVRLARHLCPAVL